MGDAREWIAIELYQFYGSFGGAIIFAFLAKLCGKKSDAVILGGERPAEKEDLFIESSFTFELYSAFFNPMYLTFVILNVDSGNTDYTWILWFMGVNHFLQLCFVITCIYMNSLFKKREQIFLLCAVIWICLSPLVVIPIQGITLIMYGKEKSIIDFSWVLADTIILSLTMVVFCWRLYEQS